MSRQMKAHKNYDELIALLESRGMAINDREHAKKKLSQVGYYRLSGFWFPCQITVQEENGKTKKGNKFLPETCFRDVYDLYLFDKKMRLLMMDALERIEVFIRSIIAHEMGAIHPLSYRHDEHINPSQLINKKNNDKPSPRKKWMDKQDSKIESSKDDFIKWHKAEYEGIPFWVVVETWDFGLMSKYYAMLNGKHQDTILSKLGISKGNGPILRNWLSAMNVLRNRCAHHSRIWNKNNEPKLKKLDHEDFNTLNLEESAYNKMYGMITVLWFLIKKIGPGSDWLNNVAELISKKPNLPGCYLKSMGFPDNDCLPQHFLELSKKDA
ncbi:Abi family protein [Xenorhabdus bovienii]|nr:Abi family protein [Xenorhabdus bovienii]MDE1489106.1 Abi family protein [Xenorhabdus bovienii]MDE9479986.1 Abi family protein [Xenorhabdus bovienii]MDE9532940.1 Abi family protein [Xenorhabdus bovienii]MDE9590218.1 Abi family protein [Xenorhabdus bovienii]